MKKSLEQQATAPAKFHSPNYENAPVIETSLAVRFVVPAKWNVHVFGLLQDRLVDAFPIFETAPPILIAEPGKMQVSISAGMPRVRALYWSASKDRLVQLQDNLFCMNWRKAESSAEYPRYAALREDFAKEWAGFVDLIATKQVGKVVLEGCSVTYINRVDPAKLSAYDVCTCLTSPPQQMQDGGLVLSSQTVSLNFSRKGQQISYVLQPAIELLNNAKITQVTLVSDNKFEEATEDPMSGLDRAHDLLIETFENLSTDQAKQIWGRQ